MNTYGWIFFTGGKAICINPGSTCWAR
jgi:hypothetical protein